MGIPEKRKPTDVSHPRGEVPEIVFREALLWMHKAFHVLGASEMHIDLGLPTWSISSAYQGAYFAARSIMAFLGMSVTEFGRVSVVVDICRNTQGMRPQRIDALGVFAEDISFRSIGVLFDHRQMWLLFQRILRVSSCEVWPEGWANYFAQIDMADIPRQRNGLHYQLQYWIMDDLHDFVYSDEFSEIGPTGAGRELFNCAKENFSLVVCISLTRMAFLLFNDLCTLTDRLVKEQKKMTSAISFERHPLFFDTLQSGSNQG